MIMYQDGLAGVSADISGLGNVYGTYPISIAQDGSGSYGDFYGNIDEVRIWNSVIDPSTIQEWACRTITNTHPNYVNLIAYWQLNNNGGNTGIDASENNNDLSIIGTTWEVDNSTPSVCDGNKYLIRNCLGNVQSIDRALLEGPNKSYALHGNYGASSGPVTPTCMIYTNALGEIQAPEWAFCIDSPLSNGINPPTSVVWDILESIEETGLSALQSAQLSWILANYADLGFNLNDADDRRGILAQAIWAITNPNDQSCDPSDAWYDLCNGAFNNVTSVPPTTTLALTLTDESNNIFLPDSIAYFNLTTSANSLLVRVSDSGNLPTFCNGSELAGHNISDNGDGTGTITLTGTAPFTLNLCMQRTMPATVTLHISDPNSFSDGSDLKTLRPMAHIDVIQDYLLSTSPTTTSASVGVIWKSNTLEIGNYIWCDSEENGIQDACELGVEGVNVHLYNTQGILIGITSTNNAGYYYFNQNNVDTSGVQMDGSPMSGTYSNLAYNTDYYLVFGTTQFNNDTLAINASQYLISDINDVAANTMNAVDSDVSASNLSTGLTGISDGLPYIALTTSAKGCGEHNYDMALTCLTTCTAPSADFNIQLPTCTGTNANNNGTISLSTFANATHYAISSLNASSYDGISTINNASIISNDLNTLQNDIFNTGGSYIIRLFNNSDNCYTDFTHNIEAIACPQCTFNRCMQVNINKIE